MNEPAVGSKLLGASNWLRPSAVEGWRRLSYQLEHYPAEALATALLRLRAGYSTAGFDYEGAQQLLDAVGPASRDTARCYRAAIEAVAWGARPAWLVAVPRGRALLADVVDADALCCMERAGLLEPQPMPEAVELLDRMAQLARGESDVSVMESARQAERLSLELEGRRCATLQGASPPEWVSLSDNSAGYDILSTRLCRGRLAPKLVEVKSSLSKQLQLFLTRNEWEVGSRSPEAWVVHFWDMRGPTLTELTWQSLAAHVPVDQGGGNWSVVIIDVASCEVRAVDL